MNNTNNFIWTEQLDIDLVELKRTCLFIEHHVNTVIQAIEPIDKLDPRYAYGIQQEIDDLDSITTNYYSKYNFFMFPTFETSKLFYHIQKALKKVNKNYNQSNWYIQSWINVHQKGGQLKKHSHWFTEKDHTAYHGYFSVNAEPSITTYEIQDKENIEIENKNGNLVFGLSSKNHHSTSIWNEEQKRITIAFDIVSLEFMNDYRDSYKDILSQNYNFIPLV